MEREEREGGEAKYGRQFESNPPLTGQADRQDAVREADCHGKKKRKKNLDPMKTALVFLLTCSF